MKILRSLLAVCATLLGQHAVAANTVPPETADTIFGIRLGVSLESQFGACPVGIGKTGEVVALEDQPCWRTDPLTPRLPVRTVLLPRRLLREVGAVTIRSLREVDGLVVEVEAEFPSADVKRVGRYLRQQKGAPAESEKYQREGRGFGISSSMAYSWYTADSALHFLEVSSSGNGTVRGFNKRWAQEEKAWRDKLALPIKSTPTQQN